MTDGEVRTISNPSEYPDPSQITKQEEPFVDVHLYTPNDYVGGLMDLCQQKRGELIDMKYLDDVRVDLHYAMPWARSSMTFSTPSRAAAGAMPATTTSSRSTGRAIWCGWTSCWRATRWTLCP